MHRSIAIIAMLAAIVVGACTSAGSGQTASIPPDADFAVVAKDYKFVPAALPLTAGEPTTLYFENLDSEQHDIAIFPSADSSEAMFQGELISRGSTVYEVPAFDAGTYFFKCTLHPIMYGDVQVTP